jgi:hypothetical protein
MTGTLAVTTPVKQETTAAAAAEAGAKPWLQRLQRQSCVMITNIAGHRVLKYKPYHATALCTAL